MKGFGPMDFEARGGDARTRTRLSRPRGARRAQCRRACSRACSRVDALACLHARGCAGSLQARGCACAPAGASERHLDMDDHSVAPAAHAQNHRTHLSSAAGRYRASTARARGVLAESAAFLRFLGRFLWMHESCFATAIRYGLRPTFVVNARPRGNFWVLTQQHVPRAVVNYKGIL